MYMPKYSNDDLRRMLRKWISKPLKNKKKDIYYRSRKDVVVCLAEDEGIIDPDTNDNNYRYVAICEKHGFIVTGNNLADLKYLANHPDQWCSDCRKKQNHDKT